MGRLCDGVAVLLSILAFLISLSLFIVAIVTDHWVTSTIANDRGLAEGRSHVTAGLFTGIREVDWGLGSKIVIFNVFSELQTGISFYSRIPWILMLAFLAIGALWIVVGVCTGVTTIICPNEDSVAGQMGIFLWSLLGSLSLVAVIILYLVQYQSSLRSNLLLPEQVLGGFSTYGRANIGYSFFLLVGSMVLLQLPPLFMLCSRSCHQPKPVIKQPSFDPTALLY